MRTVYVVGALVVIMGFIVVGRGLQEKRQYDLLATHEHLISRKVAPEAIKTLVGAGGPIRFSYEHTGRFQRLSEGWVTFETTDWVFFNGEEGSRACPVLNRFAAGNLPSKVVDVAILDVLAAAGRTTPIEVWARVPHFSESPRGLVQCPGFSYDSAHKRLTVGGKSVAIIADQVVRKLP